MFKETSIDAGEVRVGQTKVIKFEYNDDSVGHINILQGCGCSSITLNRRDKTIEMTFTPSGIPKHLAHQSYYEAVKPYDIAITFKDGRIVSYNLSFKVKITR